MVVDVFMSSMLMLSGHDVLLYLDKINPHIVCRASDTICCLYTGCRHVLVSGSSLCAQACDVDRLITWYWSVYEHNELLLGKAVENMS